MSDNAVVQFGIRPAAMGATEYRCAGGPADGQTLMLCDGDIVLVGRQPPGVNPGDPFIAISVSPSTAPVMRTLSTYRGEYELRDGVLAWIPPADDLITTCEVCGGAKLSDPSLLPAFATGNFCLCRVS